MKTQRMYKGVAGFMVGLLLGTATLGGTASRVAIAAPPAPFTAPAKLLPAAQNTVPFVQALEALSRRYNITFVAEDEPQAETIPADVLAQALRDDAALTREEATQKAVGKVADAFDYSAVRLGATFLLQKRFKQFLGELPSVTLQECALAMRDTKRAVGTLNPHVPPFNGTSYPLSDHFMKSLTQDQLAAMFNGSTNIGNTVGGKPMRGVTMDGVPVEGTQQLSSKGTVELGLPIRSLTPSQRVDVQRIAAYYFIQYPLDEMEAPSLKFAAVTNPDAVFRFEPFQIPGSPACRLLGCVVPGKPGGKKRWYSILLQYAPDAGMTPLPNATPHSFEERYEVILAGGGVTKPKDPAKINAFLDQIRAFIKTNLSEARDGIKSTQKRRESGASQTLTQAAQWLNTRPASSGRAEQDVRVAVDPALAAKRVTLVGTEKVSNLALWTAIAHVYDLANIKLPNDSVLLTRPQQKVALTFADVPDAMQRVLPRPLRSLTQYQQQSKMGNVARYRFEFIANETAAVSPNGEFTLQDLGEEGQRCLGLMLVSGAYTRSLLRLSEPLPPFIDNFDDRLLIGGLYIAPTGETQFSFGFAKEETPGVLVQGPGFGRVRYKH